MSRTKAFVAPLVVANGILMAFCLAAAPWLLVYGQLGPFWGVLHWHDRNWPGASLLFLAAAGFANFRWHTTESAVWFFLALCAWYASGVFYLGLLA